MMGSTEIVGMASFVRKKFVQDMMRIEPRLCVLLQILSVFFT